MITATFTCMVCKRNGYIQPFWNVKFHIWHETEIQNSDNNWSQKMTLSTSSRLEIKPDHQIDININQHYLLRSSPSVYPPLTKVGWILFIEKANARHFWAWHKHAVFHRPSWPRSNFKEQRWFKDSLVMTEPGKFKYIISSKNVVQSGNRNRKPIDRTIYIYGNTELIR